MYVNQIQEQGEVLIKHLSTDSIPSGALTKPLHGAPFKLHGWLDGLGPLFEKVSTVYLVDLRGLH
jgi:hypothetical protein